MDDDARLAPVYELLAPGAPRDPLALVAALRIPIEAEADNALLPVRDGGEVPLLVGERMVTLPPLPGVRALFRGTGPCAEFGSEPPAEYVPLFACIERVAADWCSLAGRPAYDEEFERLYTLLRRRPDGRDANPLFGWLRRAAQVALLVRPTRESEFDQLTRRLARAARTFRTHATSTNYWELALRPLLGR